MFASVLVEPTKKSETWIVKHLSLHKQGTFGKREIQVFGSNLNL